VEVITAAKINLRKYKQMLTTHILAFTQENKLLAKKTNLIEYKVLPLLASESMVVLDDKLV